MPHENGVLSISAGEAAEIAYAVLCSATSLLPPELGNSKRDDPGKVGHWFRGGSVFEIYHPGIYPLNQLFDEYELDESLRRWGEWEEQVKENGKETDPPYRQIGYRLNVNVFCAMRMLLTLDA